MTPLLYFKSADGCVCPQNAARSTLLLLYGKAVHTGRKLVLLCSAGTIMYVFFFVFVFVRVLCLHARLPLGRRLVG